MNAHEKEINEMLTKIDKGKLDTLKEQSVEIVDATVTNAGGGFGYDVICYRFDDDHINTILIKHKEGRKCGDKIKIMFIEED